MKAFVLEVRRFLASEDGPTAVEYAVILGLIVLVCFVAIKTIGINTNTIFNHMANSMGSS